MRAVECATAFTRAAAADRIPLPGGPHMQLRARNSRVLRLLVHVLMPDQWPGVRSHPRVGGSRPRHDALQQLRLQRVVVRQYAHSLHVLSSATAATAALAIAPIALPTRC